MCQKLKAYIPLLILPGLVSGCATPNLFFRHASKSPQSVTAPTVGDLVDHMACEIGKAYVENTTLENDTDNVNGQLASEYAARSALWQQLVRGNFVASVDLLLMVTRTEAANPSVSYVWPLTGAGHTPKPITYSGAGATTSTNNATLALGFQLSGTADRNVEQDFLIDIRTLVLAYLLGNSTYLDKPQLISNVAVNSKYNADKAKFDAEQLAARSPQRFERESRFPYCYPRPVSVTGAPAAAAAGASPIAPPGVNSQAFASPGGSTEKTQRYRRSPLHGNMALFETIEDGLTALDDAARYNLYGTSGPSQLASSITPGPAFATTTFGATPQAASSGAVSPGGAPTAASSGATTAGKTTFGAKIDFFVTWGGGVGPSLSLLNWKASSGGGASAGGGSGGAGGSGGGQLLNYSRMTQDSLTITFGATCESALTEDQPKVDLTIPPRAIAAGSKEGTATINLQQDIRTLGYRKNMAVFGTNIAPHSIIKSFTHSKSKGYMLTLSQPATTTGQFMLTTPAEVKVDATSFSISLPHGLILNGPDFVPGAFSTLGTSTFDTLNTEDPDTRKSAIGTVQWTGEVLDDGSFSLRGIVNSVVSGQTVGQIWLKRENIASGQQFKAGDKVQVTLIHLPERLVAKLNDDPTLSYWDSIPACDTVTVPQKQAAVDAISLQNQFQTFFRP